MVDAGFPVACRCRLAPAVCGSDCPKAPHCCCRAHTQAACGSGSGWPPAAACHCPPCQGAWVCPLYSPSGVAYSGIIPGHVRLLPHDLLTLCRRVAGPGLGRLRVIGFYPCSVVRDRCAVCRAVEASLEKLYLYVNTICASKTENVYLNATARAGLGTSPPCQWCKMVTGKQLDLPTTCPSCS